MCPAIMIILHCTVAKARFDLLAPTITRAQAQCAIRYKKNKNVCVKKVDVFKSGRDFHITCGKVKKEQKRAFKVW